MTDQALLDRPIGSQAEDQLGFWPLAEQISRTIIADSSKRGLVIGIEGSWGSGKTSLVNLVKSAIHQQVKPGDAPLIVSFQPWLIGQRDALLTALFRELSESIEERAREKPGPKARALNTAKDVANKIRGFSSKLGGVGKFIKVAGDVAGLAAPGLSALGDTISGLSEVAGNIQDDKPLSETKQNLSKALLDLPYRIVVIVDDLDRLEPTEALEVIRLVRAVADFPNVVYLLCYDQDVLAKNVEQTLGIDKGHEFLEKIVQGTFSIPLPESFSLRRWFSRELARIAQGEQVDKDRLANVIDGDGGQFFATARTVTRTLNAITILWPALRGRVDFADFVWTQIVRISSPTLYRWTEDYLRTIAVLRYGNASISSSGRAKAYKRLKKILEDSGIEFSDASWSLAEILPGIGQGEWADSEKEVPIFRTVDATEVEGAIRARRLSSPDHYRLYFALNLPAGTPSEAEVFGFLGAVEKSPDDALLVLRSSMKIASDTKISKGEMLLDRLSLGARSLKSAGSRRNAVTLLSMAMDEIGEVAGIDEWGNQRTWSSADRAVRSILSNASQSERVKLISDAYKTGLAVGWLTSLYRAQKARLTRGDSATVFLSPDEIKMIEKILRSRFRSNPIIVRQAKDPLDILYAWLHMGHENEVKKFLRVETKTDDAFLSLLDRMATWSNINGKLKLRIRPENIEGLLGYDAAMKRVRAIQANPKASQATKAKVQEVLTKLVERK